MTMKDCHSSRGKVFCTCPERTSQDMDVAFDHWLRNFEYVGFCLEYESIETPGANNRLCYCGRCRVCGKDLCIAFSSPEHRRGDDFLAKVYRWVDLFHRCRRVASDVGNTRELFLHLFREEDRPLAQAWLERTELWKL